METTQRSPRRKFTAEFKQEVVDLCQLGDRSIGQVARDLALTETSVRNWLGQGQNASSTQFPTNSFISRELLRSSWPSLTWAQLDASALPVSRTSPRLSLICRSCDASSAELT